MHTIRGTCPPPTPILLRLGATMLLTSLLLVASRGDAGGAEETSRLLDLPDASPRQILVDARDRFFVDFGDRVVSVTDGPDLSYQIVEETGGYSGSAQTTGVTPDGRIVSLVNLSRSECLDRDCKNKITYHKIELVKCAEVGGCGRDTLVTWSIASNQTAYETYSADLWVSPKGRVGIALRERRCMEKRGCTGDTTYTIDGKVAPASAYADGYWNDMDPPPTAKPDRGAGVGLTVGGDSRSIRRLVLYTVSHAFSSSSEAWVFFHDTATRGLRAACVTLGKPGEIQEFQVDTAETGIENSAFRLGANEMVVIYYFYRNAFFKGVKVARLGPEGLLDSFLLDGGQEANPGWELSSAASSGGRVLLTYESDPRSGRQTWRLYPSYEALRQSAVEPPADWTAEYQNHFFMGGAGSQFALWDVFSFKPDLKNDGVPPEKQFSPKYTLSGTLLNDVAVEGRFGKTILAASYLKGLVSEEIEDAGGKAGSTTFDLLSGFVGWERLLLNHDLRIGTRQGKLQGQYTEKQGRDASAIFDSAYHRYDVTLLNAYRIRYGLFYQTYDFRLPVYVYKLPAGSTRWEFLDSFATDATFHDVGLLLGYSRVDYAAKYETRTFTWFIDGDIGVGVSFADFPTNVRIEGEKIGSAFTFMLPFNLETGILGYRRSRGLRGFGGYYRAGYRAEGNNTGYPGRPGDRKDPAEKQETSATFHRLELRHGPFVQIGLVF